MSICLVGIARNEGHFIEEWIAHYLALGFDRVIIYDHESTDGMGEIIRLIGKSFPVECIPWSAPIEKSPQLEAYAHALANVKENWIAFFDLDEFLVINGNYETIEDYLNSLPSDVGAVGVNWLTFGSNGHLSRNYSLVRDAFRTGGPRNWSNNHHIKTIAKNNSIKSMAIHNCNLRNGRYVLPNGQTLEMSLKPGISDSIEHSVLQLNHYQTRSRADFMEKMARGRAGKNSLDPSRIRKNPEGFFNQLDKNSITYNEIDRHNFKFIEIYEKIRSATNIRGDERT